MAKQYGNNNNYHYAYTPSTTTYKDKKPTKEEFGIENYDIDSIRKTCSKIEDFQMNLFMWIVIVFALGMYIVVFMFEKFGWIGVAIYVSTLITLYYLSTREYKNKKIYNRIKQYDRAKYEYDWWQKRKQLDYWFSLDGRQFEIEIANIFCRLGYETRICKQGGDNGIDIELWKFNKKEIVQCKAHKSKVSPTVARDLYGTMKANEIEKAYLVTLNGVTSGTAEFCLQHNIEIWDVYDIMKHQEKK